MGRAFVNPYADACKNGHVRTEANTHRYPNGARQCKDCPSWARKNSAERSRERRAALANPKARYHQPLSAAALARLRSLVPCLGCGRVPGDNGVTVHRAGCSVEFIPENNRPGRKPKKRAA